LSIETIWWSLPSHTNEQVDPFWHCETLYIWETMEIGVGVAGMFLTVALGRANFPKRDIDKTGFHCFSSINRKV